MDTSGLASECLSIGEAMSRWNLDTPTDIDTRLWDVLEVGGTCANSTREKGFGSIDYEGGNAPMRP